MITIFLTLIQQVHGSSLCGGANLEKQNLFFGVYIERKETYFARLTDAANSWFKGTVA
jgi:hypothetical protein